MKVIIDHERRLSLAEIEAVGLGGVEVELSGRTEELLERRRSEIAERILSEGRPAYGFNRGFGHNVDLSVRPELLPGLQENLIESHSVGAGEAASEEAVRIAMLLRANSLARGCSGVRPAPVKALIGFLNHGITPVTPELGSVGASGDLAPLSHIALGLIGKGRVFYRGEVMDAARAISLAGLAPLRLEMKEGLALNNGVQFMTGLGLLAVIRLKEMLRVAALNTALAAQVMLAPDTYFRPDFHALRPHPGSVRVAGWIWDLMQGSPIREAHRDFKTDGQVQDPYNIRCAAQILGPCHELISRAEETFLIEGSSATDNPILLPDESGAWAEVISGGHFHGMPVAVGIFNLMQALSIMASLAHQRSVRFVDPFRNKGLGRDLKWPDLSEDEKSISSGMMMLEYSSASVLNDIWGSAMPSHLFNISTNSGQEDHVSMGTGLAVRLVKTLPKLAHVLAVELAYILQAAALRKRLEAIPTEAALPQWVEDELAGLKERMNGEGRSMRFDVRVVREHPLTEAEKRLSPACEDFLRAVEKAGLFPTVKRDRFMADQVAGLADFIEKGGPTRLLGDNARLDW